MLAHDCKPASPYLKSLHELSIFELKLVLKVPVDEMFDRGAWMIQRLILEESAGEVIRVRSRCFQ